MIKKIKVFENWIKEQSIKNIIDRNITNIVIGGEYYIYLYHGTNKPNYNKIIRTGKFNNGTFFSTDFEIANRYSLMIGTKKSIVLAQYIKLDALYTSGEYFIAKYDLHNDKHGASIYE